MDSMEVITFLMGSQILIFNEIYLLVIKTELNNNNKTN